MKKRPFLVMASGLILVLVGLALLDILRLIGVILMFGGLIVFFVGLFLLSAKNTSVCPNCGSQIYSRPGFRKIRNGRFSCPKCGSLIQVGPPQ